MVVYLKISIENLWIDYIVEGEGKEIILLHGWGANRHTFDKLIHHLKDKFKVYALDLPGFGASEIYAPLSVSDVTDIVHEFIIQMDIQNPIMLGHSYGGRIGICYASRYPVKSLVLVSAPAFKKELTWQKKIKIAVFKIAKKLNIQMDMGSEDYKSASDVMKKTLVLTVNYDLSEEVKCIEAPTLCIAGADDEVVPKKEMEKLCNAIKHSELITMDECGHFPYLERPVFFSLIMDAFLAEVSNV